MILTRTYKFRAYPTKAQEQALLSVLETHRRLYNDALAQRRDAYKDEGRSVTFAQQCKKLTTDRKTNPFLASINCSSCQRTLRRLDRAFIAFFRRVKAGTRKCGYPRFKAANRFDSVEFTTGDGARLAEWGRAYFQAIGFVKFVQHCAVDGKAKTITFCRNADHWYFLLVYDLEMPNPVPSTNPTIGIDLGLKSFLVTSDGEEIKPPQLYRKGEKQVARAHRRLSRKKRGSANLKKAVLRVARLHRRVANQRRDFHHKTARALINSFGSIAHEKLNITGMVRSSLAKYIYDAGWSNFLFYLNSKAVEAGVQVTEVSAHHTTQLCSCCGGLPTKAIGLGVRNYVCSHCGFTANRDLNAASHSPDRAGPAKPVL